MSQAGRRTLLAAMYAMAAVMVLSTVLDTAPRILPMHWGSREWRFGALGLALSSLVTPVLGLGLAMAAGFIGRSSRAIRALSWLALAVAVVFAVALVAFVVDYAGMLPTVEAPLKLTFRVATFKAVIMSLLAIPATAALGLGGLRSLRGVAGVGDTQSEHRGNLVVGQPS